MSQPLYLWTVKKGGTLNRERDYNISWSMIFFCYHFSHNDDGLFPEIVCISLIYPFYQIQNHLNIQIGSIPLGFVRKNRNPLDIQRSNRLTPRISSWNIFGTPRITDIFHMGVWTISGKQSRPKKSMHDRNEITRKKMKARPRSSAKKFCSN